MLQSILLLLGAMLLLLPGLSGCSDGVSTPTPLQKLMAPPAGKLYHGVFPGLTDNSGEEDKISPQTLKAYTDAVGKPVAWVYFSSEWYKTRAFPRKTCDWIQAQGAVPNIRLMLRDINDSADVHQNTIFTFSKILNGDFDDDLKSWARGAKAYALPLIVEYGTEVNGYWFQWNGKWNGAGTLDGFGDPAVADGPERFVAVYRHIIDLMKGEGAKNIIWVFHIANSDDPEDQLWNHFENYYPGDEYIDWIGVSCYGLQSPTDDWLAPFREQFDPCYERIGEMTTKPIVISEFGSAANNPLSTPQAWADPALKDLLGGRWPRVIGFAWWNERFANDDDPLHDTDFRVQELPALQKVFQTNLASPNLQTIPVTQLLP